MSTSKKEVETETNEKQWRNIYIVGALATILALAGIILDVIMGTITGGNSLPKTAIERFAQLHQNSVLGLYNLDLLNIINQLLLLPAYFALYAVHRKDKNASAALAFIIFLSGTIIFVTTNTALPMLELSQKYYATSSQVQKGLLAAAGEAMLARGEHGSLGVFIGFVLPNIAGILISCTMLKGGKFTKVNSYLGIAGSTFLCF